MRKTGSGGDADLAARLRKIREELGLSQPEMAARLGVPHRTLQVWEAGTHPPKAQILARLVRDGVDARWLLLGERAAGQSLAVSEDGVLYLPRLDVEASAGVGSAANLEQIVDYQPFRRDELLELTVHPENLVSIQVRGESMTPTLNPGDTLLVDLTKGQTLVDGIYAVRVDDTLMVKRLQHLPGSRLRVRSDNPAYEPFDIDIANQDAFMVVGRVVWAGRRL